MVTLRSLWVDFGILWDRFEITLGSLWGHSGITLHTLGSLWDYFGATLGLLWGYFGYMRLALGHFWLTLGSVWSLLIAHCSLLWLGLAECAERLNNTIGQRPFEFFEDFEIISEENFRIDQLVDDMSSVSKQYIPKCGPPYSSLVHFICQSHSR